MPKEQPPPPPPWNLVILVAQSDMTEQEKKDAINYLLKKE